MLTTQEKNSLMSEAWSNNPEAVFRDEWLKQRNKKSGQEKTDIFSNVLEHFGMKIEKTNEITEGSNTVGGPKSILIC